MKLQVANGANALERLAIDDRLESLGLQIDPVHRTIDERAADRSKVKGGIKGVAETAGLTHDHLVLDPAEVPRLPVGLFTALGVGTKERRAATRVEAAVAALDSATGAVKKVVEAKELSALELVQVFRRLTATGNKIHAATEPGVIGYTSVAQRNALRAALADYALSTTALWSELADRMKRAAQAFEGTASSLHRSQALRAAGDTAIDELKFVVDNIGRLTEHHCLVLKCAAAYAYDLIEPHRT